MSIAEKYKKVIYEENLRKYTYDYCLKKKYLLSSKQIEILLLLCKGFDKKYIAQELNISIGTLSHHLKHIYKKYEVWGKENINPMLFITTQFIKEMHQYEFMRIG